MVKNKHYIVVEELPEEQRIPFIKWFVGTCPAIEEYPDTMCVYKHDYDRWFEYFSGQTIYPIFD